MWMEWSDMIEFLKEVQFSSVSQSCPTLCDPMDCSMPGFPVYHQLPELTQTHVHRVSDAIQTSHPLLSPSPPAFNFFQHQGLFQGCLHIRWPKYWSFGICLSKGSVQSLSCVWLFATPWTAACQASLSITSSQTLLKLMSIESVMPSKHLILCHPLLLPPSIFPSIRESALHITWPKYWSFSFNISPSNEHSGLIPFRTAFPGRL